MEKLHVGFMKDLRNDDFKKLYNYIIALVEEEHLEDLDIQANLERAKTYQDKFANAFAKRERNPYAIANEKLIEHRTQCLVMLRNRLKSYLPSFIPQERVAAERIYFVMRPYGKKYYVPSFTTQSDLVDKLNTHINQTEEFKEAFTTLGFNGLMNQINELTHEIDQNYKQYITTSTQIQDQRKGVRKGAYIDLKIMIEGIMYKFNTCRGDQAKRDKLEVLMNKIDTYLKRFSTPLKTRRTQRKNQKEIEAGFEKVQAEPQKALPVGVDPSTPLKERATENSESAEISIQTELQTGKSIDSIENTAIAKETSTIINRSDVNETTHITDGKECKTFLRKDLGDAFQDYTDINSFCRNQEQLLAEK